MKRSSNIVLVSLPVLGIALSACGPDESSKVTKYDSYATLEDCVKEWEVKVCELKNNPDTGDLVWVGPPYTDHKASYKNDEGQTVERRASAGAHYMPIFIPHTAYTHTSNPPQVPVRPFASSPSIPSISSPRTSVPSVSAPSVASRGGFGSTSVSVGSSAGA